MEQTTLAYMRQLKKRWSGTCRDNRETHGKTIVSAFVTKSSEERTKQAGPKYICVFSSSCVFVSIVFEVSEFPPYFYLCLLSSVFFLHQRCLWTRVTSADPLLSPQSQSSGIVMSHSAVSLSAKRRLTFLQTLQTRFFHPPPTAPTIPHPRAAWLRCSAATAATGRRKLVI